MMERKFAVPAFLELRRSAPYHSPMRKRIQQLLAILLMLTLVVSGLQAVGAALPGSVPESGGVVAMQMNMQDMDHQCGDCDPQDCCASGVCQMTSHCLSFPSVPAAAGYSFSRGRPLAAARTLAPTLASTLIFTIYRPPWA